MMEFLFKLGMLPIMLAINIWNVLLSIVGIVELRTNFFFKDNIFGEYYHINTTKHKAIFAVPFVVLTLLEIALVVPVFLCARVINTIMEVFPIIMLIPSFIFGSILAVLVTGFNFVQYCILDSSKRAQCKPDHFLDVHPTAVLTKMLGGQ